jgi:mono/diheme cytochrome c family protein
VRAWVPVTGVLLLVVGSLSVHWVAHVQNRQNEQSRMAVFALNDALQVADSDRGELVARAGGCIACHTDIENKGTLLAGGVRLDSPFGTFVSPNISSDAKEGIGAWSMEMFAQALLNGRRPDDGHYWPAFPYPAYAVMSRQDIADLYAWVQSSAPAPIASAEHDLHIPDFARTTLSIWKALYVPDHYQPGLFVERGKYLVEGPGHCAACHAQRDVLGGVSDRRLSGNSRGPEGAQVPAITAVALKDWTEDDLVFYLEIGMTPEGDFSGGHMAAVIEHGTGHLPPEDLKAIAAYLKSPANKEQMQ